jgi:hypothetical protein
LTEYCRRMVASGLEAALSGRDAEPSPPPPEHHAAAEQAAQ